MDNLWTSLAWFLIHRPSTVIHMTLNKPAYYQLVDYKWKIMDSRPSTGLMTVMTG